METLDQRRRKAMGVAEGSEARSMEAQAMYEAALSQPQGSGVDSGLVEHAGMGPVARPMTFSNPCVGSSSPSTMEMGMVASPFHSDKVRAEVQLQRSRPTSLDSDARALVQSRSEGGDSAEPDYGKSPVSTEMVRVARVGTTSPDSSGPTMLAMTDQGAGSRQIGEEVKESPMLATSGQPRALAPLEKEATSLALVVTGSPVPQLPSEREESVLALRSQSELAVALTTEAGGRPTADDTRELVPAAGVHGPPMSSRVEELLVQMLEENRNLRMRLEQVETQSSWHSGNTGATSHGAMEHSPVSFAPVSGAVGVQEVNSQVRRGL